MLQFWKIHIVFFLGVGGLLPINAGAFFGIKDALDQASSKIKIAKEYTSDFVHDQTTYDDGPIRQALAPVMERLELYRIEKIRSIEETRLRNPMLANEMEMIEANKSKTCMDLRLETLLKERVFGNCQLDSIYKTCSASSSRVNSIFNSVTSMGTDSSAKNTAEGLYELELQLLDRLESIRLANTACSNAFGDSLKSSSCKATYPNFFQDMERELMTNCEASLVLGRVESFITDMRDFDFGVQRKIQKIVDLHTKSRSIEINLAVTLEKINASRIELEKSLGPAQGSDLTS